MNHLPIHLHGDGCWPDLAEKLRAGKLVHLVGTGMEIAVLQSGTSGGNASVGIRVDLPDGTVVLVETTLALLGMAVDAMRALPKTPTGASS